MLNPRKTNIALDANALDRVDCQRGMLVDRFNALAKWGTLTVVIPGGVRAEVQNLRTPIDVQDAVLPSIFNLRPRSTASQQENRHRVAAILRGNAKPGKHGADASHLSEAVETGCAYFITHDKRVLDKRRKLSGVLPPSLKIVTLAEFFEIFDRFDW
jgi:hypothetical protein